MGVFPDVKNLGHGRDTVGHGRDTLPKIVAKTERTEHPDNSLAHHVLRYSKLDNKRLDAAIDHLEEVGDVYREVMEARQSNGRKFLVKLLALGSES